jgi:ATP-dependent RNA helicase RhlE
MADEERENLAQIEKLLKAKLPVQNADDFEPPRRQAGERERRGEREGGRGRRERPERERGRRPDSSSPARRPADPLFSTPYTPSTAAAPAPVVSPAASRGPKKQVAALFLPKVKVAEKQDV